MCLTDSMGEISFRDYLALALVIAIGITLLVNLIILAWKLCKQIKEYRRKSIKMRKDVYKDNKIIEKSSE
jgi:hypothetical protein